MAKLTREQKIEIYNSKLKGEATTKLSLEYGVRKANIDYLFKLIDKHGIEVIRKNNNRRYSLLLKKQIVDEVLISNNSINATAIKYGLSSAGILANWIKSYKYNNYVIVEKTRGRRATMKKIIKEDNKQKTNEELIKEKDERILYLQAENEYLKKLHALMQENERQQTKEK